MSNPSRPTVPITIDGTEYKLYFNLNAIADTEAALEQAGVGFSLLLARYLPLTAMRLRALFVAGLRTNQPEITLAQAFELYDAANEIELVDAVSAAFRNYLPEPTAEVKPPADPPQPGL